MSVSAREDKNILASGVSLRIDSFSASSLAVSGDTRVTSSAARTSRRMPAGPGAGRREPGVGEDRITLRGRAPGARRPLSEFLVKELLVKIAEAKGHSNAKLRAQTAVSILLGLALCRDVLELPLLAKARNPVLVNSLGRALQTQLVDPW